ncbi:MAG: dTDP-4-dehydrorhamnose reductase [Hyphomicrobiales bacterium]
MKIMITGGEGQLGTELIAQSAAHDIEILAPTLAEMDLTRPAHVDAFWDAFRPAAVINAAAYTAVDRAETEPELAFAVNAAAPAYLGRRCSLEGIPLIHISTDYVFDGGKASPYLEEDPVAPLGVYGRSKAEGEFAVRGALDRHLIIRTSWLYSAHGANFVKTVMRLAAERDELRIVDDQIGCPTCAADLAAAILAITDRLSAGETISWGTYHYCGSGVTSWYGLACNVLETLVRRGHMTSFRITPIPTAQYPTPARRPPYSVLDCTRIESRFGLARPPWQSSVAKTVDRLLSHGGLRR